MSQNPFFSPLLRKGAALGLSLCLLAQSGWGFQGSLSPSFAPPFKNPDLMRSSHSEKAPGIPPALFQYLQLKGFYGDPQAPRVYLIQDIHMNEEAQLNISQALQTLSQANDAPLVVGVEGTVGGLTFNHLITQGTFSGRKETADLLLKEGKIAAPEHAGLYLPPTALRKVTFKGVEDPSLYHANIKAYQKAAPLQEKIRTQIEKEENTLHAKAKTELPAEALTLFTDNSAMESGSLSLADFISKWISRDPIFFSFELENFANARRLEARMDWDRLTRERRILLTAAAERMTQKEVEDLTRLSQSLKEGLIEPAYYFSKFENLLAKKKISLQPFPQFRAYLQYIQLASTVSGERILAEKKRLVNSLVKGLSLSAEQEHLFKRNRALSLQKKLTDFSLIPDEWNELKSSLNSGISIPAPFTDFYRWAEARNAALAEKLSGSANAVLIAGGFHTDGLLTELQQQGRSVALLAPKFSISESEEDASYLSYFIEKKTPWERLLSGTKLFLALPAGLASDLKRQPFIPEIKQGLVRQFLEEVSRRSKNALSDEDWVNEIVDPDQILDSSVPLEAGEKPFLPQWKDLKTFIEREGFRVFFPEPGDFTYVFLLKPEAGVDYLNQVYSSEEGWTAKAGEKFAREKKTEGLTFWNDGPLPWEGLENFPIEIQFPPDMKGLVIVDQTHPSWHKILFEEALHVLEGPMDLPESGPDVREVMNDLIQLLFYSPDKFNEFLKFGYTDWTNNERLMLFNRYITGPESNPNFRLEDILLGLQKDFNPQIQGKTRPDLLRLLFRKEFAKYNFTEKDIEKALPSLMDGVSRYLNQLQARLEDRATPLFPSYQFNENLVRQMKGGLVQPPFLWIQGVLGFAPAVFIQAFQPFLPWDLFLGVAFLSGLTLILIHEAIAHPLGFWMDRGEFRFSPWINRDGIGLWEGHYSLMAHLTTVAATFTPVFVGSILWSFVNPVMYPIASVILSVSGGLALAMNLPVRALERFLDESDKPDHRTKSDLDLALDETSRLRAPPLVEKAQEESDEPLNPELEVETEPATDRQDKTIDKYLTTNLPKTPYDGIDIRSRALSLSSAKPLHLALWTHEESVRTLKGIKETVRKLDSWAGTRIYGIGQAKLEEIEKDLNRLGETLTTEFEEKGITTLNHPPFQRDVLIDALEKILTKISNGVIFSFAVTRFAAVRSARLDDPQSKKIFSELWAAERRLSALIRNLHAVAQPEEEGQWGILSGDVFLRPLIEESFEAEVKNDPIRLEKFKLDHQYDSHPAIQGDRALLLEAFKTIWRGLMGRLSRRDNLQGKKNETNPFQLHAWTSFSEDGKKAVLEIETERPIFESEDLGRLNNFARTTEIPSLKGSQALNFFGWPSVMEIVQSHGGDISFSREIGDKTKIRIEFPLDHFRLREDFSPRNDPVHTRSDIVSRPFLSVLYDWAQLIEADPSMAAAYSVWASREVDQAMEQVMKQVSVIGQEEEKLFINSAHRFSAAHWNALNNLRQDFMEEAAKLEELNSSGKSAREIEKEKGTRFAQLALDWMAKFNEVRLTKRGSKWIHDDEILNQNGMIQSALHTAAEWEGRLELILNHIQELMLRSNGKNGVFRNPINPSTALFNAAYREKNSKSRAKFRDVVINVEGLDPTIPDMVTLNEHLGWILEEIFRNAAGSTVRKVLKNEEGNGNPEFRPEPVNGTSEVRLATRFNQEEGRVEFIIQDNGIGMSPDIIRKIKGFGRSHNRENNAVKTGVSGLGVTLSMIRAQQLGGEMEIESTPGKGTTVTLSFPLNILEPTADEGDLDFMKDLFLDLLNWADVIKTRPSEGGAFAEWALDSLLHLTRETKRNLRELEEIAETPLFDAHIKNLFRLERRLQKDRDRLERISPPLVFPSWREPPSLKKASYFERTAFARNKEFLKAGVLPTVMALLRINPELREKADVQKLTQKILDLENAFDLITAHSAILARRVINPLGIFDNKTDVNQILSVAFLLESDSAPAIFKQISKDFQPGKNLPPLLSVPKNISFAVRELIRNAAQAMVVKNPDGTYSPLKGEKGNLRVTTQPLEKTRQVELVIEDEGRGLDPVELGSLQNFGGSTKDLDPVKENSMGLGLSLSRRLIQQMGGEFHIQSRPGQGTQVRILLPFDMTRPPDSLDQEDKTDRQPLNIEEMAREINNPNPTRSISDFNFLNSIGIYLDGWRFSSIPFEQVRYFLPGSAVLISSFYVFQVFGLPGHHGIMFAFILSLPVILHPAFVRSFIDAHNDLLENARDFGLTKKSAGKRLVLLYFVFNLITLSATMGLLLGFFPSDGLSGASLSLAMGQGIGALSHGAHNLLFLFPASSTNQRKRKFRSGALLANLMDIGAFRRNDGFAYRDSLKSLIPMIHAAENLSFGSIYITHGAYPIGKFGREVHTVPTAGLHLIQGDGDGRILSSVENYNVRNTRVGDDLLTDRHGNNFAVTSLDLNPELSRGDVRKDFKKAMAAARREKVEVIMDLFSWLDVSAITPDNYQMTFHRSLEQIRDVMKRRLETNFGGNHYWELTSRETYFRPGETTLTLPEEGWWFLKNAETLWDVLDSLPEIWKSTKGDPAKRRELLEWLHLKNRDFAVLLVPDGDDVKPVFVHHLSTRAFGSANRDQIILNIFDQRVQDYLFNAAKDRIDDGVTKFRIDLGYRLLKEEIQDFLTPEEKARYIREDVEEPLLTLIKRIIDYADTALDEKQWQNNGGKIEIILESYEQSYRDIFMSWPKEVSVYYPDFYQNFVHDRIEELNFSLEYVLNQLKQDGHGRLYIYPQNFDEKSLIWLKRNHNHAFNAMIGLSSFLVQGGVKGLFPEELLVGMDPVLTQVGPDHPTAEEKDIRARFKFFKGSIARLIRVAAPAKFIRHFPNLLNGFPPEVVNNSDRGRYITLAGKGFTKGTWAFYVADFKENTDSPGRVWASVPDSFFGSLPPEERMKKAMEKFELENAVSRKRFSLSGSINDPLEAALEIHPDDPLRELRLYFPQLSPHEPSLFRLVKKKTVIAPLPLSVGMAWLVLGPKIISWIKSFLPQSPAPQNISGNAGASPSIEDWAPVEKLDLDALEQFLFVDQPNQEDKNGLAIIEVRNENLEEMNDFLSREEQATDKKVLLIAENEAVQAGLERKTKGLNFKAKVVLRKDILGQTGEINTGLALEAALNGVDPLGLIPGGNIHIYASTLDWEGADQISVGLEKISLTDFDIRFHYAGQVLEFLKGMEMSLKSSFETRLEGLRLALKAA